MIARAALIMLLAGCGAGGPVCRTFCGMWWEGTTECARLDAMESRTLVAFDLHAGLPRQISCASLALRWAGEVRADADPVGHWFPLPDGRRVGGVTYAEDKRMELGHDDWPRTSYAHEMGHALEWLWHLKHDRTICGSSHCGWDANGFNAAIAEANGGG